MAYATVQDVEARLGFILDQDEAQKLEVFLEDFTVYLDARFEDKNIDPTKINAALIKMIVARKGATFALQGETEVPYGASSYSVTSGDTSTSIQMTGSGGSSYGNFSLTRQEEILLKLFKAKIISFKQDPGRRR